jgi:threonine dehydrogenase-like Zn-dependent dehydrogenase
VSGRTRRTMPFSASTRTTLEHGSVIPLRRSGRVRSGSGTLGVRASTGEMRHVIPLVADGLIRVKELHTHTLPLSEFEEALDTFNERRQGALKVIIEP